MIELSVLIRQNHLTLLLSAAFLACSSNQKAPETPPDMVLIPSGKMRMGIEIEEIGTVLSRYGLTRRQFFEPASPAVNVKVHSFFLDRTEVTNADFAAFLEENPGWRKDEIAGELHNGDYLAHWEQGRVPLKLTEHPVTYVSWFAAMAYCSWKGGRLPTEAEWEYAAGGSNGRDYPWGDEEPTLEKANYSASGLGAPAATGIYPASPEGLYDLAGNVWEYCADPWRDNYASGEPASPEQVRGWLRSGDFLRFKGRRVVRGASYGGAPFQLRVEYRDSHPVGGAVAHVGFRCAQSASAGASSEP